MEDKTVFRLAPCPSFDVAGTEQWLEDMSRQGLHLSREGFFGLLVTFEKGQPKAVRYRLEASAEGTSMWTKHDGYPSPSSMELHEALGWEYISNRGEFHIFRTEDPKAPETDTDPNVRALALEKVKARLKSSCVSLVLWTVLYPAIVFRGTFFLTALELGTWSFLAGLLLILWGLVDAVRRVILLKRMQRQLRETGQLEKSSRSGRSMALYYGKRAVKAVLIVLWFGHLFFYLSDTAMDSRRVPLSQYQSLIPFATIEDFAGGDVVSRREIMTGMGFNTILERSDVLAPRCIDYWESSGITTEDGSSISGGLTVDYFEARTDWLAKALASELHRRDRWEKNYTPLDVSVPGVDFAVVYRNDIHFPTVILRKGNIVLRGYFYQSGGNDIPLETWVSILAESIDP